MQRTRLVGLLSILMVAEAVASLTGDTCREAEAPHCILSPPANEQRMVDSKEESTFTRIFNLLMSIRKDFFLNDIVHGTEFDRQRDDGRDRQTTKGGKQDEIQTDTCNGRLKYRSRKDSRPTDRKVPTADKLIGVGRIAGRQTDRYQRQRDR
jgi:hypothetical protein